MPSRPAKTTTTKTPRKASAIVDPPTIAEIRRVRRRMLKQAGGTIQGLTRLVEREAAKLRAEGTLAPKPTKKRTKAA